MIRQRVSFPNHEPLTRCSAAKVVQVASRYESRVMIEHGTKIVNAKSMLGLLSLGSDADTEMRLITEGPDENQAAQAMGELFCAE